MSTYLDYNSSAPIAPEVLSAMIDVYTNKIGNADSRTHDFGDAARIIVEDNRKKVATLLGIQPTEVFFTSGATESNNIAILGLDSYAESSGKKHIITTAIEHKAVLETVKALEKRGYDVDIVNPDESGRVSAEKIISLVRPDTLLVSVMHVNNETGIIQPVEEIGEALAEKNVLFHVDATQSCGKLITELRMLKYDMLSFSAHKLRGPQGIGVLVLKKKSYKLPPVKAITYGGQQEHGIRPGTVPVALIAGCGTACELAELRQAENEKLLKNIKHTIMTILEESGIHYQINGVPEYCLDNTINVCFPGVSSEALMIATKQYCGISNGSACTSKSYSPSYVLTAMGLPVDRIKSSVRISWGDGVSKNEIERDFSKLVETVKTLCI